MPRVNESLKRRRDNMSTNRQGTKTIVVFTDDSDLNQLWVEEIKLSCRGNKLINIIFHVVKNCNDCTTIVNNFIGKIDCLVLGCRHGMKSASYVKWTHTSRPQCIIDLLKLIKTKEITDHVHLATCYQGRYLIDLFRMYDDKIPEYFTGYTHKVGKLHWIDKHFLSSPRAMQYLFIPMNHSIHNAHVITSYPYVIGAADATVDWIAKGCIRSQPETTRGFVLMSLNDVKEQLTKNPFNRQWWTNNPMKSVMIKIYNNSIHSHPIQFRSYRALKGIPSDLSEMEPDYVLHAIKPQNHSFTTDEINTIRDMTHRYMV
jgi:hypothetical protein